MRPRPLRLCVVILAFVILPAVALLTVARGATAAVPEDPPDSSAPGPRMRVREWQQVAGALEHLRPRDGRQLYRGPRMLRNRHPFLVAAGADDRAAGSGIELRIDNVHRLLEPADSEAAARELARLFGGGSVVPDAATYEKLRATALRHADDSGWPVKIVEGTPGHFGVTVENSTVGRTVHTLVFTSSGFGALDVVEEEYRIATSGRVERKVTTWIHGPPQSWQTSGDVDAEEQARLYAGVRRFREAMTAVLARRRSIDRVRAALAPHHSFEAIRRQLGEPDRDIGSGVHRYVYGLADGSAVIFGVPDADKPPLTVRHVAGVGPGGVGDAQVGRLVEDLRATGAGQPQPR